MKSLNTSELSTISIKVSEEIEKSNLHNFLRTSIFNSNLFFSKNCYYYFYYNFTTFTYEIIFYEKSSDSLYLEPFLVAQSLNQNDDMINVFLYINYFVVSQNNKILILKKVNKINKDEISLYVKQIFKTNELKIVEITQEFLDTLAIKKNLPKENEFYPLYPKKSFYIFCSFIVTSFFIFLALVYFVYENENNIKPILSTQKIVHPINTKKTIDKTIELFKYIKLNHIVLDKVAYSKSKIKTILYHKNKSHLLSFANSYKKNLQIKFIKYNDINSMYAMEITVEY